MLRFDIITIFPKIFESYFQESILKRAIDNRLIEIHIHNLRDYAADKHHVVDDKPFGGGIGMVMKIEPIFRAVEAIKKIYRRKSKKGRSLVVLFTPRVKKFNQKMAYDFSKLGQLILICGRYEGIDERVAKYIADKEVSIGEYVLMGGELPAMVVVETISRLIPGIIGKPQFLEERMKGKKGFLEYPQFTRPEVFSPEKGVSWKVPKVLLGGNHKRVEEWRGKRGRIIEK